MMSPTPSGRCASRPSSGSRRSPSAPRRSSAAARRRASVGGATAPLVREFRAAGSGPVRFSGALEGTAVLPNRDRDVRMELVIGADAAGGVGRASRPTSSSCSTTPAR